MDDKKRRQQPQSDRTQEANDSASQDLRQDVSNEQEQELQDDEGETSDDTQRVSDSGENFYHNRERGNYEPGRASEEGGGSLY